MIGVISDIHGNEVALDAVLDDMGEVDSLVCLGDIIGYGPRPKQCLEKVKQKADVIVQGNHDRNIDNPGVYSGSSAYQGLRHSQKELDNHHFTWLKNLPYQAQIGEYMMVHSHPEELDKHTYPKEYQTLIQYIDDYKGLLLGHTHIQSKEEFGDKIVMNPGSVGQPRDNNPDSAYALLEPESGKIELKRVSYDIDKVAEQVKCTTLPNDVANRLYRGV